MPAKVVVQGLRKRYGDVEAVRDVGFEIHDGEIFGLIGPNGAGKTTAIECLIGLNEPDEGRIEVCGIDARRHPRQVREKIGAALQTTALQDRITPREALDLFGAFYRQRVSTAALLDRFSLAAKADAAVDTLSGGQKQRLALALAFVNDPELIFLDEPTAGLDAQSRRELHGEILRLRDDGRTVLLTTHYLDEAEALCDRIAIINRGRIVAAGRPRDLMSASGRQHRISFVTDTAFAAHLPEAVSGAHVEDRIPAPLPAGNAAAASDTLVGATLQTATPGATLLALVSALESRGIGIQELHVQKASLEDVFVDLTDPPAESVS